MAKTKLFPGFMTAMAIGDDPYCVIRTGVSYKDHCERAAKVLYEQELDKVVPQEVFRDRQ